MKLHLFKGDNLKDSKTQESLKMINQANEDIIQLIILNIYMESELNHFRYILHNNWNSVFYLIIFKQKFVKYSIALKEYCYYKNT